MNETHTSIGLFRFRALFLSVSLVTDSPQCFKIYITEQLSQTRIRQELKRSGPGKRRNKLGKEKSTQGGIGG